MSLARTLAQLHDQNTSNSLRLLSSTILEPETAVQLRRSHRERRPSTYEYEASQHESDPQPRPQSKPKSKQRKSGKRGDRPGIIIQPGTDIGQTSDKGLQVSNSGAGSNIGVSRMASPDASKAPPSRASRAEAVFEASSILGADASRYSSSTLKQIIALRQTVRQESGPGPMEIEEGDSPAFGQLAERVGLGSGLESSRGIADSVSQHIPPAPCASSEPKHTRLLLNIRPKSLQPKRTGSRLGSNIEPKEETVRSLKRQRTTAPARLPLPTRPLLPARLPPSHPSLPRPASLPARSHVSPPSVSPQERPLSLDEPPPASDVSAVLAWAARTAQQASTSHHVTGAGQPTDIYHLLTTVLGALQQSHQTASSPHASSSTQRTTTEENTAVLEAEAALVLGKKSSRNRVTLRDFPGLTGHIAALLIPKLIATVITKGAYGTHNILAGITSQIFTGQWKEELPDLRVQKPPAALISLLVHWISWACGQAKVRIRPVIASKYGFINPPRKAEDVRYSRKLAKSLLPNAFHCRGLKTDIHPYEHEALSHCLAAAFFWGADLVGMIYHHLFYPVPIPTVAMALTKMQHCISEWTTGRYVSKSLDLERQRQIYEAHLAGLANFGKDDPDRLRDMQIDWFWYAVDYAGGSLDDQEPVQSVTWADRAGTAESDPEAEADEDDVDDLYDD
ncbi:hypothetical protein RhiJN_02518 [Ceratobasidium sp. AG-Ba]|nr:hypothetical protein RhiJN_02518 [Ceratobasidium sp. AG-Ba]